MRTGSESPRAEVGESVWLGARLVDADAEARSEDRAASDEDAGDESREERGDLSALEAADFRCHLVSFQSGEAVS